MTVRRRRLLALLGSLPLAGCTGGPGDPITSLAVNRDDTSHTVAVRIARDERVVIENAVTVDAEGVAELGTTPWRPGRYRVTARVDGESALDETFRSEEWFNQLDVVVGADGSVELNRARAA
ncbi:hypothetical protein DU500_11215 [Haloplanus rubicundus]|uniref:Ig-like domain-containing protein n=1 Tax=Haloplanus rubicundus TaxID=1547898 RepID=A0A345E427_9EURY|nr:hypothetical protein [Haloplanus rubicundus]AXG06949.1 hypothetical protein DU500_11215 [Haloplanus rubicundus]AXG10319.1 hypothetical protein DU484_10950 [Haloplanus rubicundus]